MKIGVIFIGLQKFLSLHTNLLITSLRVTIILAYILRCLRQMTVTFTMLTVQPTMLTVTPLMLTDTPMMPTVYTYNADGYSYNADSYT